MCLQSFSSKAALHAHTKIHQKITKPVSVTVSNILEKKTVIPPTRSPVPQPPTDPPQESFPCKLCGR